MDSTNTNNPIIPNENEGSSPVVSDAVAADTTSDVNANQSTGVATPSDPEIVPEVQPEPAVGQ